MTSGQKECTSFTYESPECSLGKFMNWTLLSCVSPLDGLSPLTSQLAMYVCTPIGLVMCALMQITSHTKGQYVFFCQLNTHTF